MIHAWMWPSASGGVNGLNVDAEERRIIWFDDAAACACGGNAGVQSFEQFEQSGPLLNIPDDILQELTNSIQTLDH